MLATAHVAPFVLLSTALLAQSGPPPIPTELRARFGFEGPLVVKVGDGLGNLQIADVDGDGRLEAIAVDARRARLVAVRVKGRETELQPIPTNGQIAGYALADVHGDGKPNLLLVDARGRLTVRHPGREAAGPPIDLGLSGRGFGLLTGDLDGDGKQDVVVVARGSLRTVTQIGGTPKLSPIEPMEENAYSFHLTDCDGDGKLDLCAVAPGTNMNLRLRFGTGDGGFGPWRIFSIDGLHDVFPARTADGKPALGTIAGSTKAVSLRALQVADDGQALDWWAFGENTGGKTLPWALGDVDHDGDEDLVVARADRAQLLVYEWRGETFVPRTLPTLAGVTALALGDIDQDGKNDIVLVSPEEDAVAWIPGSGPIDRFPVQLATTDKPVTACVDPAGGVLVLARNEKRDATLLRCAPDQPAAKLGELGRLPADPTRLFVGDFGDGPGQEIAFVVPGEGLRTLSLGAGKIEKKDGAKATDTAGFTKKLEDGSCAPTVVDGKGALVAVRERFVRTFRLDDKGQVRVLGQDNGPDGMTELTLCAEADAGVLGGRMRYYFDKKGNKLVRQLGSATVAVEVPSFEFTHLVPHRGAALLLSARGVLRVPFAKGPSLRVLTTHEPPIVRTAYHTGRAGDFDHDGITDLCVVDRHLPGLQILAGGKDGLQRALAVPVFESGPREEPDNEPRELATGDLDGDGRTDFVLIAHDRILIYLQEP
jgi:hypothetical protein